MKNKENESIKNNEVIYDLYFGLTLPGRIIFTIYSFHGLFFIYNIIIQYIILIPSLLFNIDDFVQGVILSVIYIIFAISSANILIIPSFEFLNFPFLSYRNPKCHILSFIYIFQKKKKKKKKIENQNCNATNAALFLIQLLYLMGLLENLFSESVGFKDHIKQFILIVIYINYITIMLCYFVTSLYLIIKIISYKCCINFILFWNFGQTIIRNLNFYFEDKPDIPNVNLLSYLINPYLRKFYKKNNKPLKEDFHWYAEDFIFGCRIIIKIILMPISIAFFFHIFYKLFKIYWSSIILFVILFVVMTILSITLNFPLFYRNRKTYGTCGFCCNFICFKKSNNLLTSDVDYTYVGRHPFIISVTRCICDFITLLTSVVLLNIYYMGKDNDAIDAIDGVFSNVPPSNKTFNVDKLLLPNICYSPVHDIPLYLYLPFINDAYYYSKIEELHNYSSSLHIPNYKKLFFDDDYKIDVIGNLVNKNNTVKMVQYNVRNKKNYITILAIKGTSYNIDIYVDAQLYFSSILLNLLSTFSITSTKDSMSFNLIEYSLNIPYRIFSNYLMINDYLNELQQAYIDNEYTFYDNVVIVGHSLGGGLAKLFGRLMKKQAVSLSGPGVNAFHSLWKYEGESENFEISAIDLVPDMDLVPRVEISGGTIYRIICQAGIINCHSKVFSLCEVLIMCRNPNYEVYCKKFGNISHAYIKRILKSSELND